MPSATQVTASAFRRARQSARAIITILDRLFLDAVPEIAVQDQRSIRGSLGTTGSARFRPQVYTARQGAEHVRRMAAEALDEFTSAQANDETWCLANQAVLRVNHGKIVNFFNRSQVLRSLYTANIVQIAARFQVSVDASSTALDTTKAIYFGITGQASGLLG
ncbi:hypothetical protein BCR35DRAFT_331137 [Leucosporidium creatinivorum]|uniref:Uncharacterized protein n=1 Tax=Leucosporidium creatinivorum TaxID=106004 RepID=A0A1Y2FJC2_9BASI|nr:hypothetical protein BCR35DRAFT_331137 [Leucosporidium creatinivorum]